MAFSVAVLEQNLLSIESALQSSDAEWPQSLIDGTLGLFASVEDKTAFKAWLEGLEPSDVVDQLLRLETALGDEFTYGPLEALQNSGHIDSQVYAEFRATHALDFFEQFTNEKLSSPVRKNELDEIQVFRPEDERYWGTVNQETLTHLSEELNNPYIAEQFANLLVQEFETPEEMVGFLNSLQPEATGLTLTLLQNEAFLTALYNAEEGVETHAYFEALQTYASQGGEFSLHVAQLQQDTENRYNALDEAGQAALAGQLLSNTAGVNDRFFNGISFADNGDVIFPEGFNIQDNVTAISTRMDQVVETVQASLRVERTIGADEFVVEMESIQAAFAAGQEEEANRRLAALFETDDLGVLKVDFDGNGSFGLEDISLILEYFMDNVISGEMQFGEAISSLGAIGRTAIENKEVTAPAVDFGGIVSNMFSGSSTPNVENISYGTGDSFIPDSEVNASEVYERQTDPRYQI